jgi:uncharacterized protein (TIGR03435 family)
MTAYVWFRKMSLVVAMGLVIAVPVWGQSGGPAAKSPTYDAVSVKPNNSANNMVRIMSSGGRFSATGVTIKLLILSAYDVKMEQQISGISGPMADTRFDIEAKMDDETVAAAKKLSNEEGAELRRRMMQAMLAERFKLQVHHESKELPMYALVIAKGGFKLKEADPNDTYPNGPKGPDGASHAGMMMIRNGTLTAQGVSMSNVASSLGGQVHRIVVDKTGLTGKYDIALQWTPDDNRTEAQDAGSTTTSGPSIFAALQEQLGLKLEATKGAVDTIVVDHVEMPSEN